MEALSQQFLTSNKSLDYFVLDVFSDRRLAGNPLAVMIDSQGLGTESMQAIARETNLSETTFIERRDPKVERREGVRVRIFTTEEELPFAGHPTLGTASLLRAIAPECVADNTVRLALNVGTVPVRFESASREFELWPLRGEMTQRDPEFGEVLDSAIVASLIGLEVADLNPLLPVQVVSTGTAFAIVPLRTSLSLARLRVQQEAASSFLRAYGARWFYVLGPDAALSTTHADPSSTWRARMQFNGGEDPATGSAAGCAISHLVNRGVVASGDAVRLLQGIEMKRPSEIILSARKALDTAAERPVTDVRVGGSTVLVASGRLFLP